MLSVMMLNVVMLGVVLLSVVAPSICLSLEEVTVCVVQKVLVDIDAYSVLIVGGTLGIWGQQLKPRQIHLLIIKSL